LTVNVANGCDDL
jgi:hypothetical protein